MKPLVAAALLLLISTLLLAVAFAAETVDLKKRALPLPVTFYDVH